MARPGWERPRGRILESVARDDPQVSLLSAPVLGRFGRTALVWFIPAILLLPFALLLVAISAVAGDGSLLELGDGLSSKVLTALGPMLIASGIAALAAAAILEADTEGWISTGGFAAVVILVGGFATHRALRRIARRM